MFADQSAATTVLLTPAPEITFRKEQNVTGAKIQTDQLHGIPECHNERHHTAVTRLHKDDNKAQSSVWRIAIVRRYWWSLTSSVSLWWIYRHPRFHGHLSLSPELLVTRAEQSTKPDRTYNPSAKDK